MGCDLDPDLLKKISISDDALLDIDGLRKSIKDVNRARSSQIDFFNELKKLSDHKFKCTENQWILDLVLEAVTYRAVAGNKLIKLDETNGVKIDFPQGVKFESVVVDKMLSDFKADLSQIKSKELHELYLFLWLKNRENAKDFASMFSVLDSKSLEQVKKLYQVHLFYAHPLENFYSSCQFIYLFHSLGINKLDFFNFNLAYTKGMQSSHPLTNKLFERMQIVQAMIKNRSIEVDDLVIVPILHALDNNNFNQFFETYASYLDSIPAIKKLPEFAKKLRLSSILSKIDNKYLNHFINFLLESGPKFWTDFYPFMDRNLEKMILIIDWKENNDAERLEFAARIASSKGFDEAFASFYKRLIDLRVDGKRWILLPENRKLIDLKDGHLDNGMIKIVLEYPDVAVRVKQIFTNQIPDLSDEARTLVRILLILPENHFKLVINKSKECIESKGSLASLRESFPILNAYMAFTEKTTAAFDSTQFNLLAFNKIFDGLDDDQLASVTNYKRGEYLFNALRIYQGIYESTASANLFLKFISLILRSPNQNAFKKIDELIQMDRESVWHLFSGRSYNAPAVSRLLEDELKRLIQELETPVYRHKQEASGFATFRSAEKQKDETLPPTKGFGR